MQWLKQNFLNVLFVIFILLIIIPQTGRPIKIFIQKIIATSPDVIDESDYKSVNFDDWTIKNKKGKFLKPLENFDQPIVINFWATWCPPCIAEMPSFSETYNEFKDKVKFYFVSNEEWSVIENFEHKRNFNLPYYQSIQDHPQWEVRSIPRTIVINTKGEIIIDETGVAKWNSDSFKKLLESLSN